MSKLKQTFATATIVSVLIWGALPGGVSAVTAAELQAQIDALMAQLSGLQAQLPADTSSTTGAGAPAACSGITLSRSLTVGSSGTDVKCLQALLNQSADTQVAASGVGSAGSETLYFGNLTRAAVVKFQEKYAADILTPLGLSAGTGFFGSSTRTKATAVLSAGGAAAAPTTTPASGLPEGCTSTTGYSPTTGVKCDTVSTTTPTTTPTDTTPTTTPAVGELAVSSTGPASGTLVAGQSTANLLDVVLTGSGTVTGMSLERIGVSANTTPSNVYLFDGAIRLTDAGTVNSEGVVSFNNPNGLFIVTDSKTISVKSDIAAATNGETLGLKLTAVTLATGTASGLPVSGNLHSIALATLGTVAFGAVTPSASTLDAANDITVWESTATIGTRAVNLSRIALRQIGSINSSDIGNFRLLIGGVQKAQVAALDASGYVTFDLTATPESLVTGSRVFRVAADVTGGASRNVQMSLRRAADVGVTDSSFNVNITATAVAFPASTGAITIASGTMTVVKTSDSPSGNVTDAATDVILAKYTFTAHGESIKVETLNVGIDTSGTDTAITMRNVRIMVNGAQVGSTTSVPAENFASVTETGTQFTTNFVVTPGSPAAVEIRGDIFDNEGATNDFSGSSLTIDAAFVAGSSNAVPQISLGTINVPTANQAGNQMTVASGTISLSQVSTYGAQTAVVPQTAYKLAAFNLTGNATEAVNVNTFEIDFTQVTNTSFDASDDLTDMYIKYGANTTSVKGTVTDADNTWSINFQLAKNQTMVIELYANIGSTITATHSLRADFTVTGTTASSATTVYADVTANTTKDAGFQGQVIAAGTGSITATAHASTPDSTLLDDSGTATSAVFNFAAVNDSYTLTDVVLTLNNATAVSTVRLKDGNTVVATLPGAATVTYAGLTVPVPANTNKQITVELDLSTVGVGAGVTGADVTTILTSARARNSQGVDAAVTESNPAGNAMYVYKAIPTITNNNLPSSLLTTGTKTLSAFTVSTNATGTVAWKRILVTIAKTGGAAVASLGDPVIASPTLWDVTTGATQITAAVVLTSTDGDGGSADGTADCTEVDTACTISFAVGTDADDSVERQVSGAKSYEVRATITGTLATGDNINTNITQPSSFAASVAYASVAAAASFVWSDTSAQSHNTSSTSVDWTNGFQVKNLPTVTQTMTK